MKEYIIKSEELNREFHFQKLEEINFIDSFITVLEDGEFKKICKGGFFLGECLTSTDEDFEQVCDKWLEDYTEMVEEAERTDLNEFLDELDRSEEMIEEINNLIDDDCFVEVYVSTDVNSFNSSCHTDKLGIYVGTCVNDAINSGGYIADWNYSILDKDEYNATIYANSSETQEEDGNWLIIKVLIKG